jgi:RNA-binding protein
MADDDAPRLTTKQVAFLRSKAHSLDPQVKVGKQGDTEALRKELDLALTRHELVKVRLGKFVSLDVATVAAGLGAHVVQELGHTAVLYRPADEPKLRLPGAND